MSPSPSPFVRPGVLQGITVLDFSTLLPGPMAALMLAEAGAEVIKVERPEGDRMRDNAADFALLNRGKRSITIDLKEAGAAERLRPLILRADVVLEQFRPGVMERLGLGYEQLKAINPRIIYCAITGYGASGPRAQQPGHDLTYAAEAGLLAQTTGSDGAPTMPPALLADIGGGTYPAVINILMALLQRQRTGEGCRLEVAMFDNLFPFLYPSFASAYGRGHWPQPGDSLETGRSPRYSLYTAGDGRTLALGSTEPKFWAEFCDAIELPEALRDDHAQPEATRAAVAQRLASRTAAEWLQVFAGRDLVCSMVHSFEEAVKSPHFESRDLLSRQVTGVARTGEAVSLPALPLPLARNFLGTGISATAPALGADNAALLGASHAPATGSRP